MVREYLPCSYVFTVHTPLVCIDDESEEKSLDINCFLGDDSKRRLKIPLTQYVSFGCNGMTIDECSNLHDLKIDQNEGYSHLNREHAKTLSVSIEGISDRLKEIKERIKKFD